MAIRIVTMPVDRVAKHFENKNVLITGGSGFIGKVLIEKLLRKCPSINTIYVLIRPKKGCSVNERLATIVRCPIFGLIKQLHGPEIISKIKGIEGDVSAINLGISEEDRNVLINEIDFIYHCAATTKFDEPLKNAVFLNVRGTKFILSLAKQCHKLEVFCHVSTAYCFPKEDILYEKAYPVPSEPNEIIKYCEILHDDAIQSITECILQGYPDTYAFSKALAEGLVYQEMNSLPAIIMRVSIVMPIWNEPIPGWTDNIHGLSGLLVAGAKGILRTMHLDETKFGDIVSADQVVDHFLAFTHDQRSHDYLTNKQSNIFHCTSTLVEKPTWKDIIDCGREIGLKEMPLNGAVWYPGGGPTKSKFLHLFRFYLLQWIPAIFLDLILLLLGYKPILKTIQTRIYKSYNVLAFYTSKDWVFDKSNTARLLETLNSDEKSIYRLKNSAGHKEIHDYMYNCAHSIRLYNLKETDDEIPGAKRHIKIMWFVDLLFKMAFLGWILYMTYGFLF